MGSVLNVRKVGTSWKVWGHWVLFSSIVLGGVTTKRLIKFSWRNVLLVSGTKR